MIYIIYLDDIFIFSEDLVIYTESVRRVLERLRTYSLYINFKKCEFNIDIVEFLGFIISSKGIGIDSSRIVIV